MITRADDGQLVRASFAARILAASRYPPADHRSARLPSLLAYRRSRVDRVMPVRGGDAIQKASQRKRVGPLAFDHDPSVLFLDIYQIAETQLRSFHN